MVDGRAEPSVRLERILASQDLLSEVSAGLGPDLALEEVLVSVLKAMRRLVDFRGGTVQLVDERGVYIAAADPPVDPEVSKVRIRVGEGISGRVVATGSAMRSDDIEHDSRVSAAIRAVGGNQFIRSYVAVPLVCLGEVIGALQMDSPEVNAFDDDDVTMLAGLAAQVAGVIESARRYQMVSELERLKADFLGRVSHELRTPITIIDGLVRTLLDRDDLSPTQQREMLERCRAASARLAGLVEDLLTLTRLESGVLLASRVRTLLAPLLVGVAEASARPYDVTVTCPPDASAFVDPELLRRAVSALVDNALKYGGATRLVVDEVAGTLEVIDRGPGLPDDVRTAAFELFTRSMSTLSVPGLGLGLPLARTLLDATGATLSLDSPISGGTVARVRLPPQAPTGHLRQD
jgi:signal transduction histidine kinase